MSRLFISSAICNVDRTGHIALPRDFYLAILCRRSTNDLYVFCKEPHRLIVSDEALAQERLGKLCERPDAEAEAATIDQTESLRRDFGLAARTQLNSKGQLPVPLMFHEWRGGVRAALIVGMGDYFEIWDLDYARDQGSWALKALVQAHQKVIDSKKAKRSLNEPHLQPVRAHGSRRGARKSRLPVQPLYALQPGHDPIVHIGRG